MRKLLCCAFLACSMACGPKAGTGAFSPEGAQGRYPLVSEDQFAEAVVALLGTDPASPGYAAKLSAVTARQFERSRAAFRKKNTEVAIANYSGAFLLIAPGQLTAPSFGPAGVDVLRAAAREFAHSGDEGRAYAAYESLIRLGNPETQQDARTHLLSIKDWLSSADHEEKPVAAASMLVNASVSRFLYELSIPSRDFAAEKTREWIAQGIKLRDTYRQTHVPPAREEANEAIRAMATGPVILVALYLRERNPKGATRALEESGARSLLRRDVTRNLESLADDPKSAIAWAKMAISIRPGPRHEEGSNPEEEEMIEDAEILRVTSVTCLLQAYRLEPNDKGVALELARELGQAGMTDAATLLTARSAKGADRQIRAAALARVTAFAIAEAKRGRGDNVRRIVRSAVGLFDPPDQALEPMQNALLSLLGETEFAEGNLAEAQAAYERIPKGTRAPGIEVSLARIEIWRKENDKAITRLRAVVASERDPVARASSRILISDAMKARGGLPKETRVPLLESFEELRKEHAEKGDLGLRGQLVFARVLARLGRADFASKILARAVETAPRDRTSITQALIAYASLGLSSGSLAGDASKDAFVRASQSDVASEDLTYIACWFRWNDRILSNHPWQQGPTKLRAPDPAVVSSEKILMAASGEDTWVGHVAAFTLGAWTGEKLLAAAKTRSERTEAQFYVLLALAQAQGRGGPGVFEKALDAVLASPGIALEEYGMARAMRFDGAPLVAPTELRWSP